MRCETKKWGDQMSDKKKWGDETQDKKKWGDKTQNKNANFSESPHGPIFKFCVVIREAILQKMAPILDPVNFFSVLTLLGHCERLPER